VTVQWGAGCGSSRSRLARTALTSAGLNTVVRLGFIVPRRIRPACPTLLIIPGMLRPSLELLLNELADTADKRNRHPRVPVSANTARVPAPPLNHHLHQPA
jgi:hypothetical protein